MEKSRFKNIVSLLVLTAGVLAASSNAWGAEKAVAACHPGQDPQPAGSDWSGGLHESPHGLTPTTLPGATTVSVAEAKCLVELLDKTLVVVSVVGGDEQLPNFINGFDLEIYQGSESAEVDEKAKRLLSEATDGSLDRPLLFYCASANCYMSYNAAIRAARLGYRRIYWMRGGIDAWKAAGYPIDLTNLYVFFYGMSGIGAYIDHEIEKAEASAGAEIVRIHGGSPFTAAETERGAKIFSEEFGDLKIRLLDKAGREEAANFSNDEFQSLRDTIGKSFNNEFYKVRYSFDLDMDSFVPDVVIAAKMLLARPQISQDSFEEVYPVPAIRDRQGWATKLGSATALLCLEGTCDAIQQYVTDTIFPRVRAQIIKDSPEPLTPDAESKLNRILDGMFQLVATRIAATAAAPIDQAFSADELGAIRLSYPTAEQKKLAKIRGSNAALARRYWIRSQIEASSHRLVTRFFSEEKN